MDAKIGSYSIVHTQSLIIPKGSDAWISFDVQGWNAKFRILFENDNTTGRSSIINVTPFPDHGLIRLVNWYNSSGSATVEPLQVATLDKGGRLLAMISHWFIGGFNGGVNRLDIQFLLEERR